MFEAGMVACITISISSAYAFGEVAQPAAQPESTDEQGKAFYSGAAVRSGGGGGAGPDPWTAAGLRGAAGERHRGAGHAARAGLLYMLVNDREIMGDLVSPLGPMPLPLGVVIVLIGAGILFGVSVIAPRALTVLGGG